MNLVLWMHLILVGLQKKNGINTIEAKNINDAIKKLESNENKIIVIFGSLYLVGKVLSKN